MAAAPKAQMISVHTAVYPALETDIEISREDATLRTVVAKALDSDMDAEFVRYMSGDMSDFLRTNDGENPHDETISGESYVMLSERGFRIIIPSVLVHDSFLGQLPVNSLSIVAVLPKSFIDEAKLWDDSATTSGSVMLDFQGSQVTMAIADSKRLSESITEFRNIEANTPFVDNVEKSSAVPNIAVIRRMTARTLDLIVIPLTDENNGFVVKGIVPQRSNFDSVKMQDGDVVELTRLENLIPLMEALRTVR